MARIKQEYFQRTEALLYDYELIKLGIYNMKAELNEILHNDGLGSVDPGAEVFATNKISSVVENVAIDRIEGKKVKDLISKIKASEELISSIDKIVSKLKENQQEIVKLYYFDLIKNDRKVADMISYTEVWCGTLRRAAVQKISVGLGYSIPKEARLNKIS